MGWISPPHIYHPWEYLNLYQYCLEEMYQIFMKMASIDITSLTRIYIQIASNFISSIAWNRSYSTSFFSFVSSQRMAAESARQPKREHHGTDCQSTPILSPSDLHVCGTISTNPQPLYTFQTIYRAPSGLHGSATTTALTPIAHCSGWKFHLGTFLGGNFFGGIALGESFLVSLLTKHITHSNDIVLPP